MTYALALAIATLTVSAVVLYFSIWGRKDRANPELERLRHENDRLRKRLEHIERDLGIERNEDGEINEHSDWL